jgi:hypothetical protein
VSQQHLAWFYFETGFCYLALVGLELTM